MKRGIARGASFANKISSSSFNGFFTSFFLGLLLSVALYSRSLCAIDNITFMIIVVAYYCYCLRCAQLAHSGHHEWWYCWLSALCFVLSAILLDDGAHLLLLLLLVIHGCRSVCLLDAQWAHICFCSYWPCWLIHHLIGKWLNVKCFLPYRTRNEKRNNSNNNKGNEHAERFDFLF